MRASLGDIAKSVDSRLGPPERDIIRDLIYAWQGLDNTLFKWDETDSIVMPTGLTFPLTSLLRELLEPALLYRSLRRQVDMSLSHENKKPGVIEQALMSAIDDELNNYLRIIGEIEAEIRASGGERSSWQQETTNNKENFGNNTVNGSVGESFRLGSEPSFESDDCGLSLRMCLYLLREVICGLRLLHSITAEIADKRIHGCQILSLIFRYTTNGNQFVKSFSEKLLKHASVPFYTMLDEWISLGQLNDMFEELFIVRTSSTSSGSGPSSTDTAGGLSTFTFKKEMVPTYLTKAVALRVFETGKSLHFLHTACQDTAWIDDRRTLYTNISDYTMIDKVLAENHKQVVDRLAWLMRNKLKLHAHLEGLKEYMLLSKGEFVQILVDESFRILQRPAMDLHRHHLTDILETALRGSSNSIFSVNKYDPVQSDIANCVDARMLEPGHGDSGWELFTLEYRLSGPLKTVLLDSFSSRGYLRVFNFLWRIQWVSASLQRAWSLMALGARTHRLTGTKWIFVRKICQQMMQFIHELQYYLSYEVIETSWAQLQSKINDKSLTVDEIVRAHHEYLEQIMQKGLFKGSNVTSECSLALTSGLHSQLKNILRFSSQVAEMQKLVSSSIPDEQELFKGLFKSIHKEQRKFHDITRHLVRTLTTVDDEEMRFLAVRLDFNDFYKNL